MRAEQGVEFFFEGGEPRFVRPVGIGGAHLFEKGLRPLRRLHGDFLFRAHELPQFRLHAVFRLPRRDHRVGDRRLLGRQEGDFGGQTAVFLLQFRNRRPKLAEPLLVFLPERAHFPLVRFSGVQPHQISSGRCPRMRSSISFLRECSFSERSTLYNSGMSRRRYSSQNLESSRLEKSCISISPGKV